MKFWAKEALDRAGIDPARISLAFPTLDPATVPVLRAGRLFRALWFKGITAVALPWGIYLHPDRLEEAPERMGSLMVHELAHIDQWRRLGMLVWARSYLGDYWRGRRRGLGHHQAYRQIGLEREARQVAARIAG